MGNYSNVLLAYDGSEMAKKALGVVKQMASEKPDIKVHIINAWNVDNQPLGMSYYEGMLAAFEENAHKVVAEAKEAFAELDNEVTTTVIRGHVGDRVTQYAEDNGIDLIVIGNRGLGMVQRMLLGSVSSYVIQHAPCSVLVVK